MLQVVSESYTRTADLKAASSNIITDADIKAVFAENDMAALFGSDGCAQTQQQRSISGDHFTGW